MSKTFEKILNLINRSEVKISIHGYDELSEDELLVEEIIDSAKNATVIEDYPNYYKVSCVLVLQRDGRGNPMHILWGIYKNTSSPAVLITAYKPDPLLWSDDFTKRR
ncbi:hypothetical protein MCHI_003113 [Candidatus Magnetoovum chiemensis]|nr:hypothetical protein MCHI_003113 [Candidatus Magnetoovum chiemensis]